MFEEELPKHRGPAPIKRDLTSMSVDEMNDYIAELEAEVSRVRVEVDKRGDVRSAAEALFKRPGS